MSAGSGPTWSDPFARFDPATSCWRTPQDSLPLPGLSTPCSLDWPRSGTMRDGKCYPLPRSGHRISVNGSGSSPHLAPFPTPSSVSYGSSGNGSGNNTQSRGRPSLETMAKRLPTPRAEDAESCGIRHSRGRADTLTAVTKQLLPTPTGQDGKNDGGASQYDRNTIPLNALVKLLPTPHGMGVDGHGNELSVVVGVLTGQSSSGRSARKAGMLPTPKSEPSGPDYARINRPESGGDDLATEVARVTLCTPRSNGRSLDGGSNSREKAKRQGSYISGQLSPTFVEAMMGYPASWTDRPAFSTTRGSKASRRSPSASNTARTGSAPSATPSSPPAPTPSSRPSTPPSVA